MLVCAMNPCKCGWYGHPSGRCRCSPRDVRRYHARVSGPLLDRIDIIVEVPALDFDELTEPSVGESSETIRARVNAARAVQRARYGDDTTATNAHMGPRALAQFCTLSPECEQLLHQAFDAMALTARSYDLHPAASRARSPISTGRRPSRSRIWRRPSSTARMIFPSPSREPGGRA